ncbi:MAG: hypothetical protein A2350_20740 [Candidatus Raymondbacteria bacterium RifOxyB12_full_50_8]|nr:MAG: hypothetical protein A2350_20740 [Candidatus Raymondbacteria bacterium RifOxyB12_full_50_8]
MRTSITVIVVLVFASLLQAALSTHSFTNKASRGSHPSTLTYSSGRVIIDLFAISNATVYRAILDPNRRYGNSGASSDKTYAMQNMIIISKAGDTLEVIGPRYRTLDATAAIQATLGAAGTRCTLTVANAAGLGGDGAMISLDVMCDQAAASPITQVDSAAARFNNGDAMITFREVDPIFTSSSITCDQYNTEYNARFTSSTGADWSGAMEKVRYRIYRSTQPLISEGALAAAQLVDEIKPLTCWDAPYYGSGNCTGTKVVPLYPVDSLVLATPGTGIYLDRYKGASSETFFYFVSHTIDGAEDFSTLTQGANATNSVVETSGPGMVLLREVQSNVSFMYVNNCTLYYYVRWEAPPYNNMPSSPYDYLVGVPSNVKRPKPMAQISLHCWGGSINACYGWWYRANEGGLIISTNQFPYDWWTAYHENNGTIKSIADGTVQPFTEARYLSFLYYFAVPAFNIDVERVHVVGSSMGGSGTSLWGIRSGHIFSHLISWVGVHIPKESPTYTGSFIGSFGDTSWHCLFSNPQMEQFGYPLITRADSVEVWDYWDNTKWLAANPAVETPWMSNCNGTNDNGIGWPQAWKNAKAMIATKRGNNFNWDIHAHSTRAIVLGHLNERDSDLDFRKNQSYPALTNGSLDDSLGTVPWGHDSVGSSNAYVMWDVSTVVDEPLQWEMSLWLISAALQATETVDITPRRLQQLTHGAGSTYTWSWDEGATVIASGNTTADVDGLITIPGLTLSKTHRTLKITCDDCVAGSAAAAADVGIPELRVTPNPFNPSTMLFVSGMHGRVSLQIYNINGRMVENMTPHLVNGHAVWDASKLPSGIYMIKAVAGNRVLVKRAVLVK